MGRPSEFEIQSGVGLPRILQKDVKYRNTVEKLSQVTSSRICESDALLCYFTGEKKQLLGVSVILSVRCRGRIMASFAKCASFCLSSRLFEVGS